MAQKVEPVVHENRMITKQIVLERMFRPCRSPAASLASHRRATDRGFVVFRGATRGDAGLPVNGIPEEQRLRTGLRMGWSDPDHRDRKPFRLAKYTIFYILAAVKGIQWHGDTRKVARALPETARSVLGHELHRLQTGQMPADWKPMASIGQRVCEIRIHVDGKSALSVSLNWTGWFMFCIFSARRAERQRSTILKLRVAGFVH